MGIVRAEIVGSSGRAVWTTENVRTTLKVAQGEKITYTLSTTTITHLILGESPQEFFNDFCPQPQPRVSNNNNP